nr:hypothetical protein DSAG12_03670 [Candidatus Prometheoarchaeum syntrophicum]
MNFYLSFFGLNSIISLIASIYGFSLGLFYIIDLILTLLLIGLYFYVFFRKAEYLGFFTLFFMFYGFVNALLFVDFGWSFWIIVPICIIDFIGIVIYSFAKMRRTKQSFRR